MAHRADRRDEDRPPWLEPAPDEDAGSHIGRTVALLALGLALLAALVFGIVSWNTDRVADGGGALIAAPRGDYKVRPDDPGGLKVEGEGDAAIAASAGATAGGSAIDLGAVPEAPVADARAPRPKASPTPDAGREAVMPVPASGGRLVAAAPMSLSRTGVPGVVGGGSLVQLGAFATEEAANAAWGATAKRFGYLAPMGKAVERAEVNGRTLFLLRVNAGSADQAADICGRLRVAGEACFVTS